MKRNWLSYPEIKPKLKQKVLIYEKSGKIYLAVFIKYPWDRRRSRFVDLRQYENGDDKYNIGYYYMDVIYWMPLPEPPKFDGDII